MTSVLIEAVYVSSTSEPKATAFTPDSDSANPKNHVPACSSQTRSRQHRSVLYQYLFFILWMTIPSTALRNMQCGSTWYTWVCFTPSSNPAAKCMLVQVISTNKVIIARIPLRKPIRWVGVSGSCRECRHLGRSNRKCKSLQWAAIQMPAISRDKFRQQACIESNVVRYSLVRHVGPGPWRQSKGPLKLA